MPCLSRAVDSRMRDIAHVSEKRLRGKNKTSCRLVLESGACASLNHDVVHELDNADRRSKRAANRSGRSRPKVSVPARRSWVRAQPNSDVLTSALPFRLKRKTSPASVHQQRPKARRLNGNTTSIAHQ